MRERWDVKARNRETTLFFQEFQGAGAADLVEIGDGRGLTATRTGVGTHTIGAADGQKCPSLLGAKFQAVGATPFVVHVDSYDAELNTIDIICLDFAGAPVEITATESIMCLVAKAFTTRP